MEHVRGEMFNLFGPFNNHQIKRYYQDALQSTGVAIAFVVVIMGWVINKIFRRDLLL